ncbi:hypothetical protein [Anaeroselena agilis]|uniref:Uncharacterized protein n=1 Tax=Anaeroselena agilis TaxID=3063788 RepID=A0ABU3NTD7_9FIRM|nr:hypothetical protein [Selenomonadales bacterium 4137-cl]
MMAIKWVMANKKTVFGVLSALLILLVLYSTWARFHPAQVVTFESQQQASTPTGVQQAAASAQVPFSASQAERVVLSIQASAKEPPVTSVTTTGAKVKETVAAELKKSGGQVAIVTDPAHPAATPVVTSTPGTTAPASASIVVIPPTTTVTLNQYNIKAYPDRLIQVGGSYQEVFVAYSWRVSVPKIPLLAPHGAVGYLGTYAHTNFDEPANSRVGILLTIPQ